MLSTLDITSGAAPSTSTTSAVTLDDKLDQAYYTILQNNPKAYSDWIEKQISYQQRVDSETLSLKLGIMQAYIYRVTGEHVINVPRLLSEMRKAFVPTKLHGICEASRCNMQYMRPGQEFLSVIFNCKVKATGSAYVCPISGQAHVCDGMSCGYTIANRECIRCTISNVIHPGILEGYSTRKVQHALTFDIKEDALGATETNKYTTRPAIDLSVTGVYHTSLCTLLEKLIYGDITRDLLINRYLTVHRKIRSLRVKVAGADLHKNNPDHQYAWLYDKAHRVFRKTFGKVFDLVMLRLGVVLNFCQHSEPELETILRSRWTDQLPNYTIRKTTLNYFTRAIFSFWQLLKTFPAHLIQDTSITATVDRSKVAAAETYVPSIRLNHVALAILYMLKEGLCYSVVYEQKTRKLVKCLINLNSAYQHDRVSAYPKRHAFGEADAPIDQTSIWQENNIVDKKMLVSKYGPVVGESVRCKEIWFISAHLFLNNLPTTDMFTHMNTDSYYQTTLMNSNRCIKETIGSLFDTRNHNSDTMTIEDLAKYCLHTHFQVKRNTGLD